MNTNNIKESTAKTDEIKVKIETGDLIQESAAKADEIKVKIETGGLIQKSTAKADETKEKIEKVDLIHMKEYRLSRPVKVADKTYEVLPLNFDKLTGEDMETAASLPGAIPKDGSTSEYSKTYLMYIAARAAGITINEIRKFPITDCSALTTLAYVFLMDGLSQNI